MKLKRLKTCLYRNLREREFYFSPYLNILHSPNLSGKTNLFRALESLCFFNTIKYEDDITWGFEKSGEDITLELETSDYTLKRTISKSEQTFELGDHFIKGIKDAERILQKETRFKPYGFLKDFKNLNFFQARQTLLLSQNTPQELYKLFSTLYGVSFFTDNLKKHKKDLQTQETILLNTNKELERQEENVSSLREELSFVESQIKEKENLVLLLGALDSEKRVLDEEISSLETLSRELVFSLFVKDSTSDLSTLILDIQTLLIPVGPLTKEVINSKYEKVCPTCKRPI